MCLKERNRTPPSYYSVYRPNYLKKKEERAKINYLKQTKEGRKLLKKMKKVKKKVVKCK